MRLELILGILSVGIIMSSLFTEVNKWLLAIAFIVLAILIIKVSFQKKN